MTLRRAGIVPEAALALGLEPAASMPWVVFRVVLDDRYERTLHGTSEGGGSAKTHVVS